jgi:hypothetical protein
MRFSANPLLLDFQCRYPQMFVPKMFYDSEPGALGLAAPLTDSGGHPIPSRNARREGTAASPQKSQNTTYEIWSLFVVGLFASNGSSFL